jgi:capsular polysaccharide transport system permease protein
MARSGFEVQQAAVKALFLREIRTRFGKYRLGYFWAILEPAAHLIIMLIIMGYIMHRTMPDVSFPVFLINGIIPYFLFSNISTRSVGAIEANQGLFNYKPVKPIDTIVSRTILESLIYILVYISLLSVIWISGEDFAVVNLLKLISSWFMLITFSTGIGIIFMIIGNKFPEMEKLLPVILKPLYFISCVMFPLHSLPREYWAYVLWNPVLHAIELSRESIIPGYESDGASITYLAICTLITLFIALALYRVREKEMLTS